MSVNLKQAGAWGSTTPFARLGTDWKPVVKGWEKQGSVWVPFYDPVLNIGDAYGGGFFGGYYNLSSGRYALVISPKSSEFNAQWRTADGTDSSTSDNDGRTTTLAYAGDGLHPAAAAAVASTVGGFSDWYLPSLFELLALQWYFKPTTQQNIGYASIAANNYADPVLPQPTANNPLQTTLPAFQGGGAQAFLADGTTASTYGMATAQSSAGTGLIGLRPDLYLVGGLGFTSNARWRLVRRVKVS